MPMGIVAHKQLSPWDMRPLHPSLLWQKSKGLKDITFLSMRFMKLGGQVTGEILTARGKDQAMLKPLLDIRDSTQVSLKAQMGTR